MNTEKMDIRNMDHGQTCKKGYWLITRVYGGFIYREASEMSTSMVFVPLDKEQLFTSGDYEVDIVKEQ